MNEKRNTFLLTQRRRERQSTKHRLKYRKNEITTNKFPSIPIDHCCGVCVCVCECILSLVNG